MRQERFDLGRSHIARVAPGMDKMSTDKNSVLISKALSAIHEEALKLLKKSLPTDIEQCVALLNPSLETVLTLVQIQKKLPNQSFKWHA